MANQARHSKKDASQPEIEETLKSYGFSVHSTHEIGDGFPDLLVGLFGLNHLVEVKNSPKDKANENEVKFHRSWKGQVRVAHTAKEIVMSIRAHALFLIKQLPAVVEECERVLRLMDSKEESDDHHGKD